MNQRINRHSPVLKEKPIGKVFFLQVRDVPIQSTNPTEFNIPEINIDIQSRIVEILN